MADEQPLPAASQLSNVILDAIKTCEAALTERGQSLVEIEKQQQQMAQDLQTEVERIEEIELLQNQFTELVEKNRELSSSIDIVQNSLEDSERQLELARNQHAHVEGKLRSTREEVEKKKIELTLANDHLRMAAQKFEERVLKQKAMEKIVTIMENRLYELKEDEWEARKNIEDGRRELEEINEELDDNRRHCAKLVKLIEKKLRLAEDKCEEADARAKQLEKQNLKSLNAMLLKQTVEKRQQIDSLVQDKNELETELARYCKEKTGLKMSDVNFGLKMELALVMDFVENRFREVVVGVDKLMREKDDRESEISVLKGEANELMCKVEIEKEQLRKVCDERDSIKNGFDLQREEANLLKESVIRLEEKESNLEIVIGKLKSEKDGLVKERGMREELIEGLNKEKIVLGTLQENCYIVTKNLVTRTIS